jgi:hypothetical protein
MTSSLLSELAHLFHVEASRARGAEQFAHLLDISIELSGKARRKREEELWATFADDESGQLPESR